MAEINAIESTASGARDAQVTEKAKRICNSNIGGGQSLEQVLEQVRDARAGSVVLTVEPEG